MQVAAIGRDVADGLAAAHAAGVVHRDVKPGNVLIGTDGRVKLTDFGVSRAVDDVQLTRTGLIAGTPAFLAPEIAQGRTPTAASDVFALGATLYAAVEGVPPFGLDDNAYALLHKVATEAPNAPQHAGPLTPVLHAAARGRPGRAPVGGAGPRPARRGGDGRDRARRLPPTGTAVLGAVAPSGPSTRPDLVPPLGQAARRRRDGARPCWSAPWWRSWPSAAGRPRSRSPGARRRPQPPRRPSRRRPPRGRATVDGDRRADLRPRPRRPTTSRAAVTDPIAFVRSYYALLPGNPDAAFALLGPERAARSRAATTPSCASTRACPQVTVQDPKQTGDNTVSASVRFVRKDGTTSNESYRFVMSTGTNGSTVMESFSH